MSTKHQIFYIDTRNTSAMSEPAFYLRVGECASAAEKERMLKQARGVRACSSYEGAVAALKGLMADRRERLQRELAQLAHNEAQFETYYTAPRDLVELYALGYAELVVRLRELGDNPGSFELHGLQVTNDYLGHGEPELFVFRLPEYTTTPQTFSAALCELLGQAMANAGYRVYAEWNGPGCYSWSRRARREAAASA